MRTKQLTGIIHRWLGLSSGLVVFILGLTGCLLAFEEELRDLLYKERRFVPVVGTSRLPADSLLHIAQRALGQQTPIVSLVSYQDPKRTAAAIAYQEQAGWHYFNTVQTSSTVYINPYTGAVQYVENTKLEFFRVMLMLHYNLLLEKAGKQVVGWATIVFIVLLFSGLVLWWPRNKAAAKQRFSFRWKATTKWKRKNYDLHNILGFYALLFALIIALTGLVWAFAWFDKSVQWIANGGQDTPAEKTYTSDIRSPRKARLYESILSDMRRQSPGDRYAFGIPTDDSSAIYGYSQPFDAGYKWTEFYYDQQTGRNLSVTYFQDKPPGARLRSMNYDIHAGSVLGLPGRILMFLVSFICAGLPITGFYIWWGRAHKPLPPKKQSTRSPAAHRNTEVL